jgi:hypothetical protein
MMHDLAKWRVGFSGGRMAAMRRATKTLLVAGALSAAFLTAHWASAQTSPSTTQPAEAKPKATVNDVLKKMNATIEKVAIKDATAKEAFKWWSDTVGVKLVINWEAMEAEGVNPNANVTLDLKDVPAGTVLGLIMQRASPDAELIYQVTPWYIQIMTKKQANKFNTIKIYDVGDLVHDASVGPAPMVGLQVWAPVSVPGVSVYGPVVVGTREYREAWSGPKTNQAMGDELAAAIRSQVEPEVWKDSGGSGTATIRFFRGTLVVNAPDYVHAQMGYEPKEGPRPMVFLNKREKIVVEPRVTVQDVGVTTVHEVESTSIGVGVGVTIQK